MANLGTALWIHFRSISLRLALAYMFVVDYIYAGGSVGGFGLVNECSVTGFDNASFRALYESNKFIELLYNLSSG